MAITETQPAIDHEQAEERIVAFSYKRPEQGYQHGKAMAPLGRSDIVKGVVQVIREGGENALHYHTTMDSFWLVLSGRARFYTVGDRLIGEFGPQEGCLTPRGARYWFERVGDEPLEILQVAAFSSPNAGSGHHFAVEHAGPKRDWE